MEENDPAGVEKYFALTKSFNHMQSQLEMLEEQMQRANEDDEALSSSLSKQYKKLE